MKKPIIFLLFVLSCLVAACSEAGAEKDEITKTSSSAVETKDAKTLSQFYEKNFEEVSKITIRDGSTGAIKITNDKNDIAGFLHDIKDIKFILDENQERREGWRYSVTLFDNKKESFSFALTEVDGLYYHTEPALFPIVNRFFESIPSE